MYTYKIKRELNKDAASQNITSNAEVDRDKKQRHVVMFVIQR